MKARSNNKLEEEKAFLEEIKVSNGAKIEELELIKVRNENKIHEHGNAKIKNNSENMIHELEEAWESYDSNY